MTTTTLIAFTCWPWLIFALLVARTIQIWDDLSIINREGGFYVLTGVLTFALGWSLSGALMAAILR
jgi:hypothetical protein